jgi:hypothetical protein
MSEPINANRKCQSGVMRWMIAFKNLAYCTWYAYNIIAIDICVAIGFLDEIDICVVNDICVGNDICN